MLIHLREVRQASEAAITVVFRTACGDGVARWVGEPVQVGETYDVELTIEETLTWGSTITDAEEGNSISFEDSVLTLHGELVDLTGTDGALKVCGSIILFDTFDVRSPSTSFVVVRTRDVSLYDTNM